MPTDPTARALLDADGRIVLTAWERSCADFVFKACLVASSKLFALNSACETVYRVRDLPLPALITKAERDAMLAALKEELDATVLAVVVRDREALLNQVIDMTAQRNDALRERDEARAEVERLKACAERLCSEVEGRRSGARRIEHAYEAADELRKELDRD